MQHVVRKIILSYNKILADNRLTDQVISYLIISPLSDKIMLSDHNLSDDIDHICYQITCYVYDNVDVIS
jgi:hypothetical protein